jgi:chemotaxis protein MotB
MARSEKEELKERLEFSEHKRALLQNRLSKGSIEEDTTLWSFVDLMTLLLILFILFYSHALARKGSEKSTPSQQSQTAVVQSAPVLKTSTATDSDSYDPHPLKRDILETGKVNPDPSLEQLEEQVLQTLSEKVKRDFSIRWNQKRLIMVLGEKIAFDVGDADLLPDFEPTLKQIAEFISLQKGYKVSVAGHTDDAPINTVQFPSNWELSAIRAVNVAKFMILHGVNPHGISIEGYSAYRPLHLNSSPHNRQANRRVEITLIKERQTGNSPGNKETISTSDLSRNPLKTTSLPSYPKKRYRPFPGYPF